MAITDRSQSGLPDDDCLAFLKVDILNIHIHPAHSLWQFQPEYIKLRLRTHLVVCQRTAMLLKQPTVRPLVIYFHYLNLE